MNHIGELRFFLSGGGSNTNPNASLGGSISPTEVRNQNTTWIVVGISGINIMDGLSNTEGEGVLTYTASTKKVKWAAAGDTEGAEVYIGSGGRFLVASGTTGSLLLSVTAGSLPTVDSAPHILIENTRNGIFDYISTAEASAGDVEYRCLYLKNVATIGTAANARVWISTDAVGADSIQVAKGSAAIGAAEQTVANEGTAPTSVTFSTPTTYETSILLGDIPYGSYQSIWIKRTVPAGTAFSTPNDYFTLGYACDIV